LPFYLIPKIKNKIHLQTNKQNLIIIYYQGYHCGDPDVNGRIILRWIFGKWEGVDGVGSGQGQMAGICEYGDELLGSIKCGEFLD